MAVDPVRAGRGQIRRGGNGGYILGTNLSRAASATAIAATAASGLIIVIIIVIIADAAEGRRDRRRSSFGRFGGNVSGGSGA